MIRGTTPIHVFEADVDLSAATILFVTYKQSGSKAIEKSIDDVTIEGNIVTCPLTQKDTLAFASHRLNEPVEIQIRAGFADGSRIASEIITVTVKRILKEGEI